eukprot:5272634-Karenia_brevis.AAC.1
MLCICDIPFAPGSHEYTREVLIVERMRRHTTATALGYPKQTSRRESRRFTAFKKEVQSSAGAQLKQELQDPMFQQAFVECMREGFIGHAIAADRVDAENRAAQSG